MATATTAPELQRAGSFFRALADATRLRIVLLLAAGEQCVCVIHEQLDLPQSSVSRHLAVLRAAGVVSARRQGKWVYYALAAQQDAILARIARAIAGSDWAPRARKAAPCR